MIIIKYGVSKHYAGSMVSDRCPLGYLFLKVVMLYIKLTGMKHRTPYRQTIHLFIHSTHGWVIKVKTFFSEEGHVA